MDRGEARLAERGRAGTALEEEVMAMSVEGLVYSAGRYIGRMNPLAFAFLASSGDDVGVVAKSFGRALPDGRFQRGEPKADGLVFGFKGTERGLLEGTALVVAELVGRGVSQVVDPICHNGVSRQTRCSASLWLFNLMVSREPAASALRSSSR